MAYKSCQNIPETAGLSMICCLPWLFILSKGFSDTEFAISLLAIGCSERLHEKQQSCIELTLKRHVVKQLHTTGLHKACEIV